MAYKKTVWVEGETPLSPLNFNNMEAGIEGAHAQLGDLVTLQTTHKASLVGAVNELFTSVSNGKSQIATAITGKGGTATGSDTFAQLATAIGRIGGKLVSMQSGVEYLGYERIINVSAVNPQRAILYINPIGSDARVISGTLESSTTIKFVANATGVSARWYLIEFDDQLVKSVQRGVRQIYNSPVSVAINPVNKSRAFVISSLDRAGTGSDSAYLESNTSLRIESTSSGWANCYWQVIEFK